MGASSKSVTVGYKYYLGVHAALCHGPVDAVTQLIVGERSAWSGNVTSSSQINVNAPELFGGTKREGGVAGAVDIMMGEATQGKNSYLVGLHGSNIPAYRGIVSTVFRSFYWAAMNPYFKAPWWRVKRILQGWSIGTAWYSAKAAIGTYDMNPAHIIYQCLTDTEWGMGYSPNDMGASFTTAADKLHAEGFGLSMLWAEQSSIQDFIGIILDHINGTLRLDLTTGKFELSLVRDDYDIEDLADRTLNPSNIIELRSFQRAAWGDTANEVTVIYTGRDEQELSVTVQDPASIEVQGSIISATREYRGIRDDTLAVRVAMRDLNTSSSPLAKVSLVCNRIAWDWDVGDVFPLSWPRLGLASVPMRVISINKGTIVEGRIEIEAVEDIFGLPTAVYTGQVPSGWIDPISQPSPAVAPRAMEAPYWDIVHSLTAADIDYLEPLYGFGQLLAAKPTSDAYNFQLYASPTSGGVYSSMSQGDFCPSGTLVAAMGYPTGSTTETITLANGRDLDLMDLGGYGYIEDEAVQVISYNPSSGAMVIERGVLDTVPRSHAAGTRFYFADGFGADDPTQRVSGESVYYKPLTQTGYGLLPLASATAVNLTLNNRASRPYPPGQFKLNGAYYPTEIVGEAVVTGAHRDRLQQTVDLVDYTEGNIGPEAGTTYTVRYLTAAGTVKRTVTGLTTPSHTYAMSDEIADGGPFYPLRVQLWSAVGGVGSLQMHDFTVGRVLDLVVVAASGNTLFVIGTTVAPTIPAGAAVGDTLYAWVMHRSAVTPPAGWTLVESISNPTSGGFDQSLSVFRRVAASGEPGTTVTFTQATSGRMAGHIIAARHLLGYSVVEAVKAKVANDSTTYASAVATSTAANQLAINGIDWNNAGASNTVTPPSGYTSSTPSGSVSDNRMAVAFKTLGAAGSTTAGNFSTGIGGVNDQAAVSIILTGVSPSPLITEGGDTLITEGGDTLILE